MKRATRAPIQFRLFQFRLDRPSVVPIYRQIMAQVSGGIEAGTLQGGDLLPPHRQLAVDLSINPNTVIRAYRELELRGLLESQQGTGTFISYQKAECRTAERQRRVRKMVGELVARAGSAGYTVDELVEQLKEFQND